MAIIPILVLPNPAIWGHAIILTVSHDIFMKIGFKKFNSLMKKNGYFYDVKSHFINEKNVECL